MTTNPKGCHALKVMTKWTAAWRPCLGSRSSRLAAVARNRQAPLALPRLPLSGSGRIAPRCPRRPDGCFPDEAAASAGVTAPRVSRGSGGRPGFSKTAATEPKARH